MKHIGGAWVPVLTAISMGTITACGGGDFGPTTTVRDSAGIAIVENREAKRPEGARWSLIDPPVLEIGAVEGPEEYQFTRIEGALFLPDGRIVVADGGSSQLRFFDRNGEVVGEIGGMGDAPGEYRQISSLGYGPGDSLWVYDFGRRRFTVLSADGASLRTLNLGPELSNIAAVGRLADGSFVVRESWSSRTHAGEIRAGLSRDPAVVARYAADGGRIDTLGLFPGREIHLGSEEGRAVMSAPLFGHGLSATVAGSLIYIGDQQDYEIGVYSSEGALGRLIRLTGIEQGIEPADIEREVDLRLAAESPARRSMLRRRLQGMDHPATRPAYGRLLVDDRGNLWVGEYAPYPHDPSVWRVFDPEGRLRGSIRLPERLRLEDVRGDMVLGIWRDDLDVEHLRQYRLRRQ